MYFFFLSALRRPHSYTVGSALVPRLFQVIVNYFNAILDVAASLCFEKVFLESSIRRSEWEGAEDRQKPLREVSVICPSSKIHHQSTGPTCRQFSISFLKLHFISIYWLLPECSSHLEECKLPTMPGKLAGCSGLLWGHAMEKIRDDTNFASRNTKKSKQYLLH